jgi:hypothetical protein
MGEEEKAGYPNGGSAASTVKLRSTLSSAWIEYLSSSSLVKYSNSNANEAHKPEKLNIIISFR